MHLKMCLHLYVIKIQLTDVSVFNVVGIIFCMLYLDWDGEQLCVFLPSRAFGNRIMIFGQCRYEMSLCISAHSMPCIPIITESLKYS